MSSQQLLTIGGIILFTFLTLTFNSSRLNQSSASDFNEAVLIATDLGQGLLEEIHTKAFDEETITQVIDTVIDLTPHYCLCCESGEGLSNDEEFSETHQYDPSSTFDDIDDYHGFSRNYSDKLLDNFNASVQVCYVCPSNPCDKVNAQTFAKRVDVIISNTYLATEQDSSLGTLKFSTLITY